MPFEDYASAYHTPIMVEEVLSWMGVKAGGSYLDGTAGGGGHSRAILVASSPGGRLLALDRDPRAVAEVKGRLGAEFGDRLTLVQANYSEAAAVLSDHGLQKVDGLLIDAGVSSHQLDQGERGFSFQREGPLDMRMGPEAPTVAEFLDDIDAEELATILHTFGEIRGNRRLARIIIEAHRAGELKTTTDLAALVASKSPRRHKKRGPTIHPATLVFQALRIAVNEELEHLQAAIRAIPDIVKPGGRAVFISFHSLEDRIVKHGFRTIEDPCTCPPGLPRCGCGAVALGEVLTRRPITASEEEIEANPRARSAKLRALRLFNRHEIEST